MLQDIGSPRGIAHEISRKYWSKILGNVARAGIAITADYKSGEVVVGGHVFPDEGRLDWAINMYESNPFEMSVYVEFTAASGGSISGRLIVILKDDGSIDSERTNALDHHVGNPTMLTMAANQETIKCFKGLLDQASVDGIVTVANSSTLGADEIT